MNDSKNRKFATEMDYDEFCKWATEYMLECFFENGLKGMRNAVLLIINQAANNKVFGGDKHK